MITQGKDKVVGQRLVIRDWWSKVGGGGRVESRSSVEVRGWN